MRDGSLVSSLYLVYRFGHLEDNALALLFCNLPIIVAYIKKQPSVAVLLSLIIIIYSSTYHNVSIIWLILKYLVYLLTYYYVKRKELKEKTYIITIVILQGIFLSIEFISKLNYTKVTSLIEIILIMLLFSLF